MYKREIKNLIKNIKKPEKPKKIDLVLEGGSFNGMYHFGALLFLKELEKEGIIKIDRISGVSVGSYCAVLYLTNNIEKYRDIFKVIRENWKKKQNLSILKNIIKKFVDDLDDKTFNNIKENKLFICYNNIKNKEKIVKHKYKNKEDLMKALENSSYIPHISNKEYCNEGFFIDGGMPHIFENREINSEKKILYISISQLNNIKNMIVAKDINGCGRILYGILKCYEFFFNNKNNNMCSYVNNWNILDYLFIRSKQIFVSLIIYLLILIYNLKKVLEPYIENNSFILILKCILKEFYKDIVLNYCF